MEKKLFERPVKIADIEIRPHNDTEYVVIKDVAGNEFSNWEDSWVAKMRDERHDYIGGVWTIKFTLNGDYLNFDALIQPDNDPEPLTQPLDKVELYREQMRYNGKDVDELELSHELRNVPQQVQMNRIGVAKAVMPLVAAELQRGHIGNTDGFQAGSEVEDVDAAIRERLDYWKDVLFHYAETGSFTENGDNDV